MLWCTNAHKLGIECIPNDVQSDGCAERWATPCNKSIKCLNIIRNDTSGRERPSSSMSTYRAPTDDSQIEYILTQTRLNGCKDENGQRCRVENMRKKQIIRAVYYTAFASISKKWFTLAESLCAHYAELTIANCNAHSKHTRTLAHMLSTHKNHWPEFGSRCSIFSCARSQSSLTMRNGRLDTISHDMQQAKN